MAGGLKENRASRRVLLLFHFVQLKIWVKMKSRAGHHCLRVHVMIKEWVNLNLASIKQLLAVFLRRYFYDIENLGINPI